MPIFIYNSLSRKKEEFIPLKPKEIKMYVCGPTVYDQAHIGHARSAYIFDVMRRYLIYKGYKVKFVRNVTDVDDKIIDKAQKEFKGEDLNIAVNKVSTKYLNLYHAEMRRLGILDPDFEPKATEYVSKENPLMQDFIDKLIRNGCAYVSEGDVYFDIKKAKNYGKLSNQAIEKMESGARVSLGEKKKDPLDFALWKSAKVREPAWDSPWGKGRPGWHIECSVMSSDILGDEFDIHGGGIDLIFPHHENEIAQSEGAGNKFARCWIHHGLLTINGQKMAKSLGNFITVKDCLGKYSADTLKLFFLSTQYSHPVDFTEEKMQEFEKARGRFKSLNDRLGNVDLSLRENCIYSDEGIDVFKNEFEKAMDDNFNTPQALAALFKIASIVDGYFTEYKKNITKIIYAKLVLETLTNLFGLVLTGHSFKLEIDETIDLKESVKVDIVEKIKLRNEARKKKDFATSDKVRKELEDKGIILEDTKDGTIWRRKL